MSAEGFVAYGLAGCLALDVVGALVVGIAQPRRLGWTG